LSDIFWPMGLPFCRFPVRSYMLSFFSLTAYLFFTYRCTIITLHSNVSYSWTTRHKRQHCNCPALRIHKRTRQLTRVILVASQTRWQIISLSVPGWKRLYDTGVWREHFCNVFRFMRRLQGSTNWLFRCYRRWSRYTAAWAFGSAIIAYKLLTVRCHFWWLMR